MYSVKESKRKNGKLLDSTEINLLSGFQMGSKNKVYKINNCDIREIKVINKDLANPLVCKKVFKKYNALIVSLTELLVDDDDSGDTCRIALNQIEKFRLEIKNKYRAFLTKKELEKMSKELTALQKEAKKRLVEIHESYLEYQNSNNRSK